VRRGVCRRTDASRVENSDRVSSCWLRFVGVSSTRARLDCSAVSAARRLSMCGDGSLNDTVSVFGDFVVFFGQASSAYPSDAPLRFSTLE